MKAFYLLKSTVVIFVLRGSFGLMGDSGNYYYIEPQSKFLASRRNIEIDEVCHH